MTSSNINAGFAPYAFNINLWSCSNGNPSMAHEIGHNLGLTHDRPNAGGGTPAYSYAYGYGVAGVARDVMAIHRPAAARDWPCFRRRSSTFRRDAGNRGGNRHRGQRARPERTSPTAANFRRNLVRVTSTTIRRLTPGIFRPSSGPGGWSSSTGGSDLPDLQLRRERRRRGSRRPRR